MKTRMHRGDRSGRWSTLTLIPLVVSCGGGVVSMESHPAPRDIVIDGTPTEWRALQEKDGLQIGVMNDNEYLYVSIVTTRREHIRQIAFLGLNVWIDSTAQGNEQTGVRFPVGVGGGFGGPIAARGRPGDEADEDFRIVMMLEQEREVELVRSKDDIERIPLDQLEGIDVDIRYDSGTFGYELRVPFEEVAAHRFSIGAKPGDTIRIGITTPEIDFEAMRDRRRQGGGGPQGGERSGGMRGRGMRRPSMPDPIEVWAEIDLTQT